MARKDPVARKAYGRAYNKRYYEENREQVLASHKRYREENREARNAYNKRYHEENRKARKILDLKRKYGLSMEEYTRMLIDQAGLCCMCEKPMIGNRDPHVDHDHETGYVRALLCHKCNLGLHYVEEDETFAENAKKYLEKFPRW